MDGHRNYGLQQSRSTGNLKSQCASGSRLDLLSGQGPRKERLTELRQLLHEVTNSELSNRLYVLVQDIFMDAEYR